MIDNKIYNSMVKNVVIKNICLKNLELSDVIYPDKDNVQLEVQMKYKCDEFNAATNVIEFYPKFDVKVNYDEKELFSIKFTMRAVYALAEEDKYEDEYIQEFINRNVPINVWAYAREIISSMTTRIGYPAIFIEPYIG